jgi:hypothetical protein
MPAPRDNANAVTHGANTLKRILSNGKLDHRSSVGRALRRLRAQFTADLGGQEALSTQESALVDRVVIKILVLHTVEGWTLRRRSLVKRSGQLPAVLDRNYISWSESLRRDLVALGLKRRAKDLSLNDFLKGGH